ncbi:D-sorbitol dehydrogenase-like protein [Hasllibacter halocynthiae]|uniref:D-sorbitol dehydrogenase-like protein n=1 Tax=Hasllibacter halocynthiae TaxID=595589 RepID=A0A2T0X4F7_9RHOB|nr:sugar dehydrogenase complex small subunit [Hasllibacter halocynthiae]PRY93807.1 D-sorbitol dehydrogenase-like protein [Hasllibacter halocynthiae]
MDDRRRPTRRDVLLGLAGTVPAVAFLHAVPARGQEGDTFMRVSRLLTGEDGLQADVAERIAGLLAGRIDDFPARLSGLADAIGAAGTREDRLAALSDEEVDFALQIAKPWYLGYVGSPSSTILDDDAVFATFLQGQSWEKILDQVPRPTYPGRSAGWWSEPPPAVDPPAMPAAILDWTFHPGGPDGIVPPEAEWRDYATADHDSIEAARRAKPGARTGGPGGGQGGQPGEDRRQGAD